MLESGPKWYFFKKAFNDEECARIINLAAALQGEEGGVGDSPPGKTNVMHDVRRCEIKWLHRDKTNEWIYDRLEVGKNKANNEVFGFNLYNCQSIQYTTYYGDQEGFYDFHADEMLSNQGLMRKLSCIVLLSDPNEYQGGQFEFREAETPTPKEFGDKGDVILFPSFYVHKVNPVTAGTRRSLVAWFEGPRWT